MGPWPVLQPAAPVGGAGKPEPGNGEARLKVRSASLHSPGGPSESHRQSLVYENILENLLDGVMSVSLDGRVMTFNPAAARMLGCRRDDVVGHTLMEAFFAVEGFDDFNQAILDAVTERDRTERQVVEVNVGGELRSLSMTTSYLTSPDAGEPIGVIAVFSDITEVQALQQAERLMARELEEQNAELKESYRSAEEHRERLDTVLKRVQVARGIATVLVIGLFLGAGLWSWGGFDPHAVFGTGASPAQGGEGEAAAPRTVVLQPEEFASPTLLVGRLVPSREVPVTSAADGHVADISFAYGRRVSQGETLLRLDMDETRLERLDAWAQYEDAKKSLEDLDNWESGAEVASAQRAFTKARIAMEGEAAALKRSEFLAKEGLIPASQHEDARRRFRNQQLDFEAARQDLDAIRAKSGGKARQVAEVKLRRARNKLRAIEASLEQDTVEAPISGVVSMPAAEEALLAEGRSVTKGDTLLVISDVDRMAVVAPVDEVEVASIRPGQPVTVRGDAFPGLEMRGTVSHVSPEPRASKAGEAPRFEVRVNLDDPGDGQRERMRAGMSAHLRIVTYRNPSALMIPIEALDGRGEATVVRVLDEASGELLERTVELGLATLEKVEVTGGLQAGEIVALRRELMRRPQCCARRYRSRPFMPGIIGIPALREIDPDADAYDVAPIAAPSGDGSAPHR